MSTVDTSTWNPDADLNTAIEDIPLNADAGIAQTWQALRILMAAVKGDGDAIKSMIDVMQGATASADGASGLVPAPEAGDQDKFLKGDGTWGTVAASSVAWSDVTGKPSTFTPSSHTHGNLTNDGKLSTASRAVVTDGNKAIGVSSVTSTELDYLSGVTSAVQTQIDSKAADSATVHTSGNEAVNGLKTFYGVLGTTVPDFNANDNHSFFNRMLSRRDTLDKSCSFFRRYRQNTQQGATNTSDFYIGTQENADWLSQLALENICTVSSSEISVKFSLVPDISVRNNGDKAVSIEKNLGNSSKYWDNAYFGTSAWSPSDARFKSNIEALPDELLDAWSKVDFKVFQMKDAIAKKGDKARLHVGIIAQEAQEAFASAGCDAGRFGFFGHDEWGPNLKDDMPEQAAGDRYSIRYEEALILECACQRRRADRLEARIKALEERLK